MSTVLLFGGQGGQQAGMFERWSHLPAVRDNLDLASEILGENAWSWDTHEALQGTRAVQLSLLALQTGVAQTLREGELGFHYAAGHSLGAWSAAVAAGALTFSDALRMVDIRARGMAAAAPEGYGMIAVVGLGETSLRNIVSEVSERGEQGWLSNLNSPTQITVSGSEGALRQIAEGAEHAGAQQVTRLKVAVPAHSPMMAPARNALALAMENITVRKPSCPLLANTTGRLLRRAEDVGRDLVAATDQPVRWGSGVAALAERGVARWIQVSPGRQLIGLLPRDGGEAEAWCVDNVGVRDTLVKAAR